MLNQNITFFQALLLFSVLIFFVLGKYNKKLNDGKNFCGAVKSVLVAFPGLKNISCESNKNSNQYNISWVDWENIKIYLNVKQNGGMDIKFTNLSDSSYLKRNFQNNQELDKLFGWSILDKKYDDGAISKIFQNNKSQNGFTLKIMNQYDEFSISIIEKIITSQDQSHCNSKMNVNLNDIITHKNCYSKINVSGTIQLKLSAINNAIQAKLFKKNKPNAFAWFEKSSSNGYIFRNANGFLLNCSSNSMSVDKLGVFNGMVTGILRSNSIQVKIGEPCYMWKFSRKLENSNDDVTLCATLKHNCEHKKELLLKNAVPSEKIKCSKDLVEDNKESERKSSMVPTEQNMVQETPQKFSEKESLNPSKQQSFENLTNSNGKVLVPILLTAGVVVGFVAILTILRWQYTHRLI